MTLFESLKKQCRNTLKICEVTKIQDENYNQYCTKTVMLKGIMDMTVL